MKHGFWTRALQRSGQSPYSPVVGKKYAKLASLLWSSHVPMTNVLFRIHNMKTHLKVKAARQGTGLGMTTSCCSIPQPEPVTITKVDLSTFNPIWLPSYLCITMITEFILLMLYAVRVEIANANFYNCAYVFENKLFIQGIKKRSR